MNVKNLIKELQKIEDQDSTVLIASDGEGNSYGTIEKKSISLTEIEDTDIVVLILSPWEQSDDINELV